MEEINKAYATFRERDRIASLGGGVEKIEKQHESGKMTARERIEMLLDKGTFVELDKLMVHRCTNYGMDKNKIPGDGIVSGYGKIDGRQVFVYAYDFTVYGGSLSASNAKKIVKVQQLALKNGAPIIALNDSRTFGEWLHRYRFTIARRFVQFCILLAFIGTFRFGWKVLGHPLLAGDLSSSRIFDTVPLADPFAALQRLVAQYWLSPESMIGAGIILAVYWVVSGRSFCSWVCPMNLVTDFAFWCRKKLGINTNVLSLSSGTRYVLLAIALILSIVTGTAAFEAISPQGILWREIVYGGFLGLLSAVFGIFALDLAVTKRGWCGHLCPLGAFWALWGKIGLTKVKFDNDTCTRCGDCIKVCPEPQVINFKKAAEVGMYASGECTNCGKCVSICPENSLNFGIRLIKDSKKTQ